MAKIQACAGNGVRMALPDGTYGRAQLVDLHDEFVANALEGLQAGQIVRAVVKKPALDTDKRCRGLSLKQSCGAQHAGACTSHRRLCTAACTGSAVQDDGHSALSTLLCPLRKWRDATGAVQGMAAGRRGC
jgi:hypothetical protein